MMSRIALLAAGLVATLALAAPIGATSSATKVTAKVKTLKAGMYKITVNDKSNIHDFHLTGPGVNKVITTTPFKGTKTVTVTLRRGTYTYVCDPHASTMKGSFR